MRLSWVAATAGIALAVFSGRVTAQDLASWQAELAGDAAQVRVQLKQGADRAPNNPIVLEAYAEFLDRHRDPEARTIYTKLSELLERNRASNAERLRIARRVIQLDLIAGDRATAERHLADFRSVGGSGLNLPSVTNPAAASFIDIPGPLRSFARMSAVSPDISPEDFLPALSHNITLSGYTATRASETLEQTEYLKLINRYLAQARELEKLTGAEKMLRVETCESSQTGDLLRILGYRMRGGCGSDLVLETVNPSRPFLTIDSGFPLSELETALRTNRPFVLDYHPTRVPVMFTADYWKPANPKESKEKEFIDYFMSDPTLCRLYTALSALDPDIAEQIHKDMPAARAKVYAHVWDFFGGMFELRDGRANAPGGARSEKTWTDLVGVGPDKGATFFERLVEKDDGWMAAYYDSIARVSGPLEAYLSEPAHLKRFYEAIRGRVTSPGPARPVFRANTDLILLTTRMRLDANGKPHIPGSFDIWKNLFAGKTQAKFDARLAKAAPGWKDPDDVIEALFGLGRKIIDNEPLKIYMALTDVERNREKPLEAATVEGLIRDFKMFGQQYPMFAEAPAVSDATIVSFLETMRATGAIRDQSLRYDTAGILQSLASLWQIFVRQDSIPPSGADAALAGILQPFAKIQNQREVFDAGLKGLQVVLSAAGAPKTGSTQDHILDLLAGTKPAGENKLSDAHEQMIREMTRTFEAQRLASLDTVLGLAERLEGAAAGQKIDKPNLNRLTGRITEIQLPRSSLTPREHTESSAGYWSDKHIDMLRKLNLRSGIDKAGADAQKLRDIRGSLTPVLRDTLVGLNYVHYAPPGAQVLFTNPTFVRNHDFFGSQDHPRIWAATEVAGSGWPGNSGGRLVGSLISLPYALAEAEQNFLIPTREQALIWGDLVPQMIQTAVIPRWWTVTPGQLHWVGLNMAYAETQVADAAMDEAARRKVSGVLSHYLAPARLKKVERMLSAGDAHAALEQIVPSEMYLLARELAPADKASAMVQSLNRLAAAAPNAVTPRVISHAFGTPKPMLSTSYQPELLNLRTFPTLMGYSSRILAESWESNLLYYGALADQVHMHPQELNLRVPEWTQKTVERIFATHLEDWPALLRSLRLVGDDVRRAAQQQQMVAVN